MPRATWTQCNFNAGEWSPLTHGRADLDRYRNALSLCLNYVPTAQGGLTRRPGTRYVAEVKNSANPVRLIPFEFSITQAYVLEVGPNYVRFYTNDGRLETSPGVAYEVATPYGASDIQDLQFTQSADVLYLAHPSYAPRKLVRAGALSWTLSTISFLDGPYLPINSSTTTLTLSATSGSVTVTASASTFAATDVGRLIRFKGTTTWGWLTITAYTSATQVTATVNSQPDVATATTFWRLGVWGGTNGYPGAVCFYQDRLFWGGSTQYPSRIDGSNTSDYENMAPSGANGTVADNNAVSFSLNASKVSYINWLISDERGLLAGTASGEWVIAASTLRTALTPTNVVASNSTSYGSTKVTPVRMGKSTLFVQRTKRKLREFAYTFSSDAFEANDVSMIGEHLTKSGLKQMAPQMAPQPILWIVRNDGKLVGMSYERSQEILGWHQHQMGGYSDAGGTAAPLVESVAVIPAPSVDRDEVWVVVNRYINGSTKRYVEYMTKFWEDGDAITDAVFLDASAVYSGAATTTVTGLTWLVGQTVQVLADGTPHPDCVVSGGASITLNRSATKVQVGLGYTSAGRTMRIEAGGADGRAQGKLKRVHRAIFRFFQSVGITFQGNSPVAEEYPESFRSSADLMDNPVALYTGDKRWTWDGDYDTDGYIYWEQNQPLPSNVLMIAAQLETQDGG